MLTLVNPRDAPDGQSCGNCVHWDGTESPSTGVRALCLLPGACPEGELYSDWCSGWEKSPLAHLCDLARKAEVA